MRVRKMNARNKVILKILDRAELNIVNNLQEDNNVYETLLKKLIVQVFIIILNVYMKTNLKIFKRPF